MNNQCFVILLLNAIAYVILFVAYIYKKRTFDIGAIILSTWVIGSIGSMYYYTFEVSYLSYDNITALPLIYLFTINYLLFHPFIKTDYRTIKKIEVYNLKQVFNFISIFFSVIGILPLFDATIKLTSFSLIGAALADMYSADEDKTTLIFSPFIRPFFSLMRHFTVFITFLFFFQLTSKKINKLIVLGLGGNIITFLLVALLSGSRGGILSLLLTCAFFLFTMKSCIQPIIVKALMKITYVVCGTVLLGIAAISVSRLSDMGDRKGMDLLMDQWISQYAGEGIIRFDNTIWHLDYHLNGTQNLPYLYSYVDDSIKDLDMYANKADNIIKTPVTVFYTYVGDLLIDFGIIGTIFVALIILFGIRFFIRIRNGKISFYHLIILSFFYEYLAVGFTANIYRTYYTQIQIVETLILLGLIYIFQKINEKYNAIQSCNSYTSI